MSRADLFRSGFLLATLAGAGCGKTCEGDDRQRVVDALSDLQAEAYSCGLEYAFDLGSLLGCVQQVTANAQKRRDGMSEACQEAYDGYLKNLSVGTGSSSYETMCSGDVCCDSTGCYGD